MRIDERFSLRDARYLRYAISDRRSHDPARTPRRPPSNDCIVAALMRSHLCPQLEVEFPERTPENGR